MIARLRALGAARLGAYAATWLIWGSTYLAIRVAVQTAPPLLLVAVRSLTAGAILVAWALARRERRPTRRQVGAAAIVGVLFFVIGHGGLFWAERHVASGPAALMIATEHFWMLLAGAITGRVVATRRAWLGMLVGLAGVGVLTIGGSANGGVDRAGAAVLLVAAAAWGVGTFFFTGERKPASPFWASGLPLVCGGAILLGVSTAAGEPWRFSIVDVSADSIVALAYLIVFGSVIAFTALQWLVEHEGPNRALSFTYVNPLVAVVLGAVALGEPLTWRVAAASAAIVAAVVLVIGGTVEAADTGAPPARKPGRTRRVHARARSR